MRSTIFILLSLSFLLGACGDDEVSPTEQLEIDIEIIDDYLAENGITAQVEANGMRYVIHEQGGGARPTIANTVTVNYEGRFLSNDEVFDSGQRISFPLTNVIAGWQFGIPLVNVGGSITLYVPSGFAYGMSGRGSIPPNAILIFDVDLLDVQ